MIDRRTLIAAGALGGVGILLIPGLTVARAATDQRFVFVIMRGAADGLNIVAPTGDPAFASARGVLARDAQGGAKLDSMFTLHPAMVQSAKLYAAGEALFVHAVASPYRDRSHFDGQNVLETGGDAPYRLKDGWMNRMLALLPPADARAIAIAPAVPLALRGPQPVETYAAGPQPRVSDDLLLRVSRLYEGDEQLHAVWERALSTRALVGDLGADAGRNAVALGTLAAKMLAGEKGARIAMIESGGWDTHTVQRSRLIGQLTGLDGMIAAMKAGLGPDWNRTTILVATEFGRTVAPNGTGGTDHGTASVAMLFGGGVKGGRVIADWPGLAAAGLYQGRDLKPTASLHSVVAGAVAGHFGLEPSRVVAGLFPGSTAKASEGLARA